MIGRLMRLLGMWIPWGEEDRGSAQIRRSHEVDSRAAAVERRAAGVAARWERSGNPFIDTIRGVPREERHGA